MSLLFSWLSKILASTLVAVLAGAVITGTLNQTVLSSHYLESHLAKTDSYNRLSAALIKEVQTKADGAGNPEIAAKLTPILTPNVLQVKINSALDQMQNFYRGNGPQPVIDLTDLAAQAQAAGVPIPADSGLNKPIKLSSSSRTQDLSKQFDHIRTGTLVTSLVLAVAILALSWERHKYAALPDVAIGVGALLGLLAVSFGLASGLAAHYIKFDTASNAFAMIGRDLATSIATDLARRFGIIAAVFLAVGIGTRIWLKRLQAKPVTPSVPKVRLKQPA